VFLITWQQKLRRSGKRYDHGTPIPVDLNVSGHRQHGVFSEENGSVQTNGCPALGWGRTSSFLNKQNALTGSVFAGLKKLSGRHGANALTSTAVRVQVPEIWGTDLKRRYQDDAVSRGFEDGLGHD
jgi:hypothetical protein